MKNVPMSAVVALLVAAVLGFLVMRQEPASGQSTLEQRVAALESGHVALQQQIQQLRTSLQARPAGQAAAPAAQQPPPPAPLPAAIRIGSAPALGRADVGPSSNSRTLNARSTAVSSATRSPS